ncbi:MULTISPECIES: hypothetical protein [unclassified Empedobacter]|uniref:hypothetical protein n=1 Tax=unclassified Empedobacter TaxID=2643773 RepID=UPI0025B7BC70|nr:MULTISPECIES: hypothetical protein [unclassified Empedobacter]
MNLVISLKDILLFMYYPFDILESFDQILKLEVVGYDEPNSGRELLIPKITIEGVDITERFKEVNGGSNRIIMNVNFEFSHSFLPVVFIPYERNFILYYYKDDIISIINHHSNFNHNWFVMNFFSNNFFVFISRRNLIFKNLINNTYYKIHAKENELFKSVNIDKDDLFILEKSIVEINDYRINYLETLFEVININEVEFK